MPPQIAVVLSGCGVFDGTEVHEAAAALGKNQATLDYETSLTNLEHDSSTSISVSSCSEQSWS